LDWEENVDVHRASNSNQNNESWKKLWKLNIPPNVPISSGESSMKLFLPKLIS
jgi:hypothetical protein